MKVCSACEVFSNNIFTLSLRSGVVLVKVCYVCEVFDHAAFGRVIFKSYIRVSLVQLCCPCEGMVCFRSTNPFWNLRDFKKNIQGLKEKSKGNPLFLKEFDSQFKEIPL